MAYKSFDNSKPDFADNGKLVVDEARENIMALRDAIIAGMGMPGWNMATSGGTAEEPTQLLYSNGVLRVKVTLTWGTSGGADGNITQAVLEFSSDSGGIYDTIGTVAFAYDANGELTGETWT